MYILSNFNSPYCFISFIIGAMFMFVAFCTAAMGKVQEPMSNLHFYVAREKNGELWLYIGKPIRCDTAFRGELDKGVTGLTHLNFRCFGLNEDDYAHLKWEDEPVEVFVNMKD